MSISQLSRPHYLIFWGLAESWDWGGGTAQPERFGLTTDCSRQWSWLWAWGSERRNPPRLYHSEPRQRLIAEGSADLTFNYFKLRWNHKLSHVVKCQLVNLHFDIDRLALSVHGLVICKLIKTLSRFDTATLMNLYKQEYCWRHTGPVLHHRQVVFTAETLRRRRKRKKNMIPKAQHRFCTMV